MKYTLALLFILGAGVPFSTAAEPARLNILFLVSDDLRPDLGCYGNAVVKSPNIDRLAQPGMVFNRAYSQQAVCTPSRSSVMTGMRPDTTKVWDLNTHFRKALPEVVTLSQHFENHGYFAHGIGKFYHGDLVDSPSWSATASALMGQDPDVTPAKKAGGAKKKAASQPDAPLIISVPGMKAVGKRTDALVEFVDMYPTVAELAGLPLPANLEGTSFKPLVDDPQRRWKSAAFSQYPRTVKGKKLMGYSMRTDRYRFTQRMDRADHSKVEAVELYDHQTDPQENIKIANAPANMALVERLTQGALADWKGAVAK